MLSDAEFLLKLKDFSRGFESFERSSEALRHNINVVGIETDRVRDLCENAHEIIDDIDAEFTCRTSLTGIDYTFLAIATALQTARWILIDYFTRFGDGAERDDRLDHDDKTIKDEIKESEDEVKDKLAEQQKKGPFGGRWNDAVHGKTWQQILADPVPFDTIKGSADFGLGLNGSNHRERTLGHDPVLGWIFGTINIMTDTTTMKDLRTFRMRRFIVDDSLNLVTIKDGMVAIGKPDLAFDSETTIADAFRAAHRSAVEDKKRLWCALAKEGIHLKSDFFTKCGLPVPILTKIAPELSSHLYNKHYDALCLVKDVGIIGLQAGLSVLINLIISFIHGLYFDPTQHKTRDLYEVKTRKILLLSNVFASGSNLISVAVRSGLGDPSAWKHLDFGGLAVTLWRIITDTEFMRKVREEYIRGEFKKLLTGNELDLKEI